MNDPFESLLGARRGRLVTAADGSHVQRDSFTARLRRLAETICRSGLHPSVVHHGASREGLLLRAAQVARKGFEVPRYFVTDGRHGSPEPQAVLFVWTAEDDAADDAGVVDRVNAYVFDGSISRAWR